MELPFFPGDLGEEDNLEEKIPQLLKDPKYKKYYESINLIPAFMGGKEYMAFLNGENARLTEYLKGLGLLKKAK